MHFLCTGFKYVLKLISLWKLVLSINPFIIICLVLRENRIITIRWSVLAFFHAKLSDTRLRKIQGSCERVSLISFYDIKSIKDTLVILLSLRNSLYTIIFLVLLKLYNLYPDLFRVSTFICTHPLEHIHIRKY